MVILGPGVIPDFKPDFLHRLAACGLQAIIGDTGTISATAPE
jgi:hypothetical protein